jgi:hypothetical protein
MKHKRWILLLLALGAGPAAADVSLTATDGTKVQFKDVLDGCPDVRIPMIYERCRRFELLGDFQRVGFHLVQRRDYESNAWFLVDRRSGRITGIDGIPFFSPDGKRFLIINDDVANDHPYTLAIWRRVGDGAEVEWSDTQGGGRRQAPPEVEAPYNTEPLAWEGDRIRLAFHFAGSMSRDRRRLLPARSWTGSLSLEQGKWILREGLPMEPGTGAK